jgi:hypothetical protein
VAIEFGEIEEVALTEIWPHEAADFTPWLAQNVDALGAVLGLELELVRTEAAVGGFSCDILARDLGANRLVVIENQIKPTDHGHLGQLITYASGLGGEAIVWVAKKLRDEHRQAIEWLNERTKTGTDFWGVEIKVIKIGDSRPAFQFQVVAAPFEGETSNPIPTQDPGGETPLSELYRGYFQRLINELRDVHHFTNAQVAQPQSWYAFSSGAAGLNYAASFGRRGVEVQLAIQFGTAAENKVYFDLLIQDRVAIEQELGIGDGELLWERMDDRQMSRVSLCKSGSIRDDTQALLDIHNWMVTNLLKFRKAFGPRLHPILHQVRPTR